MIICRSAAEISRMRAASQLVAAVLTELESAVAPGVTSVVSATSVNVAGSTRATRSGPVTAHTASVVAATSERSAGGSHGARGAAESNVLVAASRRPTWPDPAS